MELDTFADDPLVQAVTAHVEAYMAKYDASHDWSHIRRVLGLARHIYARSENRAELDLRVVHLAALLHDVGDHKYQTSSSSSIPPEEAILSLLLSLPPDNNNTPLCPKPLAKKLQQICLAVSYSKEIKTPPEEMAALLRTHPELAVVQDADRLDAIGAVGIGRVFTYGASKAAASASAGSVSTMANAIEHMDEKLLRLEGMAKTAVGREMMRERTERLRVFRAWWVEEVGIVDSFSSGVSSSSG